MRRPTSHYRVIASLVLAIILLSTMGLGQVKSILAQRGTGQPTPMATSAVTPAAQPTPISTAPFYPMIVQVNDFYGYIDASGKVVIQPQFRIADPFSDGMAAVLVDPNVDTNWGYIDTTGKMVIPAQFSYASDFINGRAEVRLNGEVGWVDKTGTFFDLHAAETLINGVHFSEGLAGILLADRNPNGAYIDEKGKIVIGFQYATLRGFHEGLAAAYKLKYGWGYIDHTGRYVIQPNLSYNTVGDFSEGLALASVADDKATTEPVNFGFIDKTGKFVIPARFRGALDFSEGLAVVWFGPSQSKFAYIDKTGTFAFPSQFDYAASFSEGLALVEVGNKWGYIDHQGKFAIQPQFDNFPYSAPATSGRAGSFYSGFAEVAVGDKIGYIDKTGKFIWQPSK